MVRGGGHVQFTRRSILGGGIAGAAALSLPRTLRAQAAPTRVLEIFLKGGWSPWRSFYHSTTLQGTEPTPTWSAFETVYGSYGHAAMSCSGLPNNLLGGAARPLHGSALIQNAVVAVMKHDLLPHEVATPYAVTGSRLGRPEQAGLATAVNEAFGGVGGPNALVLDAGDAPTARSAATQGLFGASSVPPVVSLSDRTLRETLEARSTSDQAAWDDLEESYADAYAASLGHPALTARTRSSGYDAYEAASRTVHDQSDTLAALLAPTAMDPLQTPTFSSTYGTTNKTWVAIKSAAQMLQDPAFDVRYVAVVDPGVIDNYDTHDAATASPNNPCTLQAGNMYNVAAALRHIDGLGLLAGVLVVLNTEFGRLDTSGTNTGSEHWPQAYVNVLLGGPLVGRVTRGSVNASGVASGSFTPGEMRRALAHYLDVETVGWIARENGERDAAALHSELGI